MNSGKTRKRSVFILIFIDLLALFLLVYLGIVDKRIGGIFTFILVLFNCLIWSLFLLSSDADYAKKVNLDNRYKDISSLELEKMGIDASKYKNLIFEKFKIVHEALSNLDLDVLKSNVTLDLYNHFLEQLEISKALEVKSIMKDIELINIKIYEVDDFRVKAYLNVKMYDYQINLNTLKCVYGSDKKKKNLEFEIYFEKKTKVNDLYNQYVISKKYCINDMDDKKTSN